MNHTLLYHYLDFCVEKHPYKIALIEKHRSITYFELKTSAIALGHNLAQKGVKPGDRVIAFMNNSIEFVISFWAVQYFGAVFVPINPSTPTSKLPWLIDNSGALIVIVDGKRAASLKLVKEKYANTPIHLFEDVLPSTSLDTALTIPPKNIIDQDLSTIIYTSGSTGQAKGVMLTHSNMVSASQSVASYLQLTNNDKIFCALPMSFDYGLHQITMTALVSATLIIETSFSQPLFVLRRMLENQATVFPIVPTMLALIEPFDSRFDFTQVKKITNTAATLYPRSIDRLRRIFPNAQIFSMYGLTECHRCTYLEPEKLNSHKESVGKAIPNTELWVVDEFGNEHRTSAIGELVIRGSTVMRGYWKNPNETAKKLKLGRFPGELVLYTGDICRLDEEGYLFFLCRKDDVFKSCGEKVAPLEVESILMQHPDVSQVAVIGIPNENYGDEIVAFVESKKINNIKILRHWCKKNLESYKIPHKFRLVESLPKNNNNKIDRHFLKTLFYDTVELELAEKA